MKSLEEILFPPRDLFDIGNIAVMVNTKNKVEALMQLVFSNEVKLSNRALWVMSHCDAMVPGAIQPYYEKLILHLKQQKLTLIVGKSRKYNVNCLSISQLRFEGFYRLLNKIDC